LLLIPLGESLSSTAKERGHMWFNMHHSTVHLIAVVVTIVGVVIADYTSDALQSPSRAYLLDLCRAGIYTYSSIFWIVYNIFLKNS
jgi:glucose uptake protein GlcU